MKFLEWWQSFSYRPDQSDKWIAEQVWNAALDQAAKCADEWTRPSTVKLAAGEMTRAEFRTAVAVARGVTNAIRSLKSPPPQSLPSKENP